MPERINSAATISRKIGMMVCETEMVVYRLKSFMH
jgi:hypothetical protein